MKIEADVIDVPGTQSAHSGWRWQKQYQQCMGLCAFHMCRTIALGVTGSSPNYPWVQSMIGSIYRTQKKKNQKANHVTLMVMVIYRERKHLKSIFLKKKKKAPQTLSGSTGPCFQLLSSSDISVFLWHQQVYTCFSYQGRMGKICKALSVPKSQSLVYGTSLKYSRDGP